MDDNKFKKGLKKEIIVSKSERYEHAKARMELDDLKDKLETLTNERDFFKNELEKERCSYANV